jgi:hypothetical protein
MSMRKILITIAIAWLAVITLAHAWLNLHLFNSKHATAADQKKFRIGFLPVTCPVTDFINKGFASRNPQFSLVRILR